VVTGTLENIVDVVNKAGLKSPAIIIIGQVVTLRDTLRWFEDQPLFGKRVLVTRSREQASVLSEKLEALGAEAWEYPTIKIKEPDDVTALDSAVAHAGDYNWIIFTSVNGVQAFFQRLKAQKLDIRSLKDAKICAIGPKTAEALEERGLLVDVMPEVFRAEAVIEALKDRIQTGDKVLLPRADLARQVLVDSLQQLGAQVDEVIAYQTVLADATDTQLLLEKLQAGEIHVLTFTSSSTVTNFLILLGEHRDLLQGITIACIGPITAETAEKNGLTVDICAESYTIDGLVAAIQKYFA
jgi:uroporphyrinogen III methyltransferase/synthase